MRIPRMLPYLATATAYMNFIMINYSNMTLSSACYCLYEFYLF